MASNSYGNLFRITTLGESHGSYIGVVIDGCPSNITIDEEFINYECNRRRPGQSSITTSRNEEDVVRIISGVYKNKSTGAPICIIIENKNQHSEDYKQLESVYRPSHADYPYHIKYGNFDIRGGGRSSARETVARVAAGAIAKSILKIHNIDVIGYVSQIGNIICKRHYTSLDLNSIESSIVRCPDKEISLKMENLLKKISKEGDSIGGKITCIIKGVPAGIGEPIYDKLSARLAYAILSINACKGFEYGSGFKSASMKGSKNNDIFISQNGKIITKTNNNGGILGGISTGMDIWFNAAFKPISSISKNQKTVDYYGNNVNIEIKGRHDVCPVPRAVPIVEAMTAITIVDMLMQKISQNINHSLYP